MIEVVRTISGTLSSASIDGKLSGIQQLSGGVFAPSDIGTVIPDTSLSKEGRSADAKIVGERLAAIDIKVEQLETEVGDASILLSLI